MPTDTLALAGRFATDAAFRRECLEQSLANRENVYATVRLANYTDGAWGRLPVESFRIRPVVPADLGREVPSPDATWHTVPGGDFANSTEGLRQRGEHMFTRFPAQVERAMIPVLRDETGPARYGLWQTAASVGGLVWVALPGGVYPALTCSSCHALVDAQGGLRPGVPNHRLDLGKAKDDYLNVKSLYSTWGPGRQDIAADGQDNPVVIADLRTVRFQRHLHRTANVRGSLPALALRIETGLIVSHFGAVRPEPRDAFALAYYIWTLADQFAGHAALEHAARPLFQRHCGSCHQDPYLSGDAIPASSIQSPLAEMPLASRGTGKVRVPSLLGVSARRFLLAGGEAEGIEALLDPGRQRGGHYAGRNLSAGERSAIAAYLRAL